MNEIIKIDEGGFSVEFVRPPIARVELIGWPIDAVTQLATIVRGYKQVYSSIPPSPEEQESLLADINRTKLHTPLEMLNYTWLVQDVTRAWTHQAVRTRIGAAFVQESMRFSDKRNARVLLPPAIEADGSRLEEYVETVKGAFQTYATMVADGVPIQDARGVLPHNVLTHAFVNYTLSTLAKTASLRYCCQAQNMKADGEGEWKTVLEHMRATLPEQLQRFVCAPWEAGEVSCGFEASFDRPCAWPEKFQPNLDALLEKRGVGVAWRKAKLEPVPPEVVAKAKAIFREQRDGQAVMPSTAPQSPSPVVPVSVPPPVSGAWHPPVPDLDPFHVYWFTYGNAKSGLRIWVDQGNIVFQCLHKMLPGGDSFMFQDTELERAEQKGGRYIWVHAYDTGQVWYIDVIDFLERANHNPDPQDYKFKANRCIPLFKMLEVPNGH